MAGVFAALGRLGQSLLGTTPLQQAQRHLASDEGAFAWRACEDLKFQASAEALATAGVAAAAVGRLEEAVDILRRAAATDGPRPEERAGCEALKDRAEALLAQSRGERGLLCGPFWRPEPPPPLPLPSAWESWASAMPRVAEFAGPVEVRWMDDGASGERGLYTSRPVSAGEVLLVALPIAEAPQNGPALVAALQQRCRVSGRARRRLRCLADGGGAGRALSPEKLAQALYPIPDEVPEPLPEGQAPEGDLQLQEILNHNVFVLEGGSAALYGLPSIFNHCCDGRGGSTMKLILTFLDKAMIFTATRDMDAGEELCHRYFDVEGDLAERHGQSTRWEFACRCTRCAFEADILPKSPAADVVHRAVTEFKEELRFEMRALSEALKAKGDPMEEKRWPLLRRLVANVEAVSAAAKSIGWGEAELGWCLALVQQTSNAALWCLLTHSASRAANAVEAPEDPLALRIAVLRWLELGWRHTERFGYDHLQNLHLLFAALEEKRTSVLARTAMSVKAEVVEPMTPPDVPLSASRVPAPWRRLTGDQFRQSVSSNGLRPLLEEAGGLIQVNNFLSAAQAEETLQMLQGMSQEEWVLSENKSSVDADHHFWRYEGAKLDGIKALMQELEPQLHPILHGAKYDKGGRITLHNDALRWVVKPAEASERFPAGAQVYRKVALIYYLTKDWSADFGGCLVDNMEDGPKAIVPEFNSLVAFLVPREHWVSEMQEGSPLRYTLFGWLHDYEPYPSGALRPLGSGNPAPGISSGGKAAKWIESNSEALAAMGATEDAKQQCEHGFRMRFGIDSADLRLGEATSTAQRLLFQMRQRAIHNPRLLSS